MGNLVNYEPPKEQPMLFESFWDQGVIKVRLVTSSWSMQPVSDSIDALKYAMFR